MKEPIEELFKQSLKGHEMPYNPDAWKAMNARLDVVSPVATTTSYLKYYLGAAGIGVAAIATYFFIASGNSTEQKENSLAKETTIEQTSTVKATPNNSENGRNNNSTVLNSDELENNIDNEVPSNDIMKSNSDSDTKQNETQTTKKVVNPDLNQGIKTGVYFDPEFPEPPTPVKVIPRPIFEIPAVSDLCLNEEATISNKNLSEIYLLDGLNQIVETIPANSSIVFKPAKVGNYAIGYKTHTGIEKGTNFRVNRIPDADFTIDFVNKFENGLPSTHVEGIGGQGTYIWKATNQTATGVESDLHFYKKGNQTIELTVNNGQCSSTVEKTIFVENDYNLMAVTGFTPMSNDPKKSTFMPFALTQRENVHFTLTIIDGRDGGIVYQTTDASLPWDGTDIRSGRRSETPQVYVWKAVISNPETNEPTEYVGTITMN